MSIIESAVFQTVISGVLVFICGEIIQKFILEPIKDYRRIIGAIDNGLKYYAHVITSPKVGIKIAPDLYKELRKLSCDLESTYKQIPTGLGLLSLILNLLKITAKEVNVAIAAQKLIFLSNSLNEEATPIDNNAALNKIRQCLNIPGLSEYTGDDNMTMIPLILSAIAVWRLWGNPHTWVLWTIVGVTVLAWLINEAVRNSYKMEASGESDKQVTKFWTKASMGVFVVNCGIAIYGIVKSF